MQTLAAGSATGNKHISHLRSTPVSVQMGSSGREVGRAMKKDEQSEKETHIGGKIKETGGITFFMATLITEEKIWWESLRSEVLHLFVLFYEDSRAAGKDGGPRIKTGLPHLQDSPLWRYFSLIIQLQTYSHLCYLISLLNSAPHK